MLEQIFASFREDKNSKGNCLGGSNEVIKYCEILSLNLLSDFSLLSKIQQF